MDGGGGGGWGFKPVLSERQRHNESVRFVRIESHVPHVAPDLQRVKKLLLAGLRDDRW